ncbi:MAG: MATE family efflux transporter, partial [Firmicutes bacterium]|nr:MATE family efflux transporter [Bacillota bacterium]
LRCGGDTRYAMITEVGTVWLIGVPLAFITSLWLGWPVYLAVLAVKAEEVVKGILLLRRYLSKKWLNTVIEGVQ